MSNQLLIISGYIAGRPTGGVTMHVHRLIKKLIEPKMHNYVLCDYKTEGIKSQLKKIRTADVMHVHVSNPYLKLFYAILGKMNKTVTLMTVHGRFGCHSWWNNYLNKMALKITDIPILINRESYDAVSKFNSKAVFIPAFIPPVEEEETLSIDVKDQIIRIKKEGHPLFVTNASSRAFTDDGKEIYGIDFLIEFFSKHMEYCLIILDPQGQYYQIYENNLPNNITIITGKHSFCAVMNLADVVIRNTPIDGDSFSVKEALYYNKRILATDAVSRPQGVFLFHYNDIKSLEDAIAKSFAYNGQIQLTGENALEQYYRLYCQVGIC